MIVVANICLPRLALDFQSDRRAERSTRSEAAGRVFSCERNNHKG